MNIDICVTSFNELKNINLFLQNFNFLKKRIPEINKLIFVDNGSSDGTSDLLNSKADTYLKIISLFSNLGYGGGLRTAILNAESNYICLLHADNQFDINDVARCINIFIASNRYRKNLIVKGFRINREDPITIRILSYIYNLICKRILGVYSKDINGLPKIFSKNGLNHELQFLPVNASFDSCLMGLLKKLGDLEIVEVPVNYNNRIHGASSWSKGKIWISLQMFISIIKYRFIRLKTIQ